MFSTGDDVVCIYSDDDIDGFVGAWCVWRRYPNALTVPASRATDMLDLTDRQVYLIGCPFPVQELVRMAQVARTVTVIERRESFQVQLSSYVGSFPNNLCIIYDPQSACSALTWDYLNFQQRRPAVINYIEDRTLWRFQYPETRYIVAALQSYLPNFQTWDNLILNTPLEQLMEEGQILSRRTQVEINRAISTTGRRVNVEGYDVPMVNVTPTIVSDTCSQLARGEAFAVGYWDTPSGRHFSLHSTDQGVDVSQLARHFGGGGSQHAARFEVPREHQMSQM